MAANEEARPFGQTEVVKMSRTISVSTGAPYGVERVCDVWEKRMTPARMKAPLKPKSR